MMEPTELVVEEIALREKAKKRGRAYQCLPCYYKKGETWINEKLKLEEHIYKNHVKPHEVPFSCRLCRFKCMKWEQLVHHATSYTPHVDLCQKKGYTDFGKSFLMRSPKPYTIGPLDYVRFEPEDSIQHLIKVMRKEKGATANIFKRGPGVERFALCSPQVSRVVTTHVPVVAASPQLESQPSREVSDYHFVAESNG